MQSASFKQELIDSPEVEMLYAINEHKYTRHWSNIKGKFILCFDYLVKEKYALKLRLRVAEKIENYELVINCVDRKRGMLK